MNEPQKAKAKIRVTKTGQEYLMLVLKINLKGLLINYIQDLVLDEPVELDLKLPQGGASLHFFGSVHKILDPGQGGKGTIIKFLFRNTSEQKLMEDFIANIGNSQTITPQKPVEPKEAPAPYASEKTVIVQNNSLSHLSLESPDREANFIPATVDEENLLNNQQGLSGQTVVAHVIKKKSKSSAFWSTTKLAVLGLMVLLALGVFVLKPLKHKTLSPATDLQTPLPEGEQNLDAEATPAASQDTQENLENTSDTQAAVATPTPPPKKTPPPKPKLGVLHKITTQETRSFVRISITGTKGAMGYSIIRVEDPKRLHLNFNGLDKFQNKPIIAVGRSPVLKIKTKKIPQKGLRVTLDLYPIAFPKYDIKTYPNAIDVFLYR